ncbi:ficolin-1 [Plakobranchus ocellatus]|uniref:Ficolin-1 n=1 Tax=Plakobranchus ocellatus TaxID=259542 RepID=A0AAV4BS55_9GAST|nr:ficolin-1 [Plakobranchus ocellatus]
MVGLVWIFLALPSLLGLCTGLKLTLDGHTQFISGNQPACGVLRCLEESAVSRPLSISRMSIFKKSHFKAERSLVTNVSSQLPMVSTFRDSMKMDGRWSEQRTHFRLYLLRPDLCRGTEFTCEVSSVDEAGEQLVSVSNVGQPIGRQDWGRSQSECPGNNAGKELRETVDQMQAWLERVMDRLENRLEDKLMDLQSRLDDKTLALQSKLEDKILALQNRLDDKLSNLQNVFDEKSRHLENRLEDKLDFKLAMVVRPSGHNDENSQGTHNMDDSLSQTLNVLEEKLNTTAIQTITSINDLFESQKLELYENLSKTAEDMQANFMEAVAQANASLFKDIRPGPSLAPRTTCERSSGESMIQPVPATYHVITPAEGKAPYVCDPNTDGGGWIVIQRRSTGNIHFERDWAAYRDGFGALDDDFWLGNERIHQITSQGRYELRIDLRYQRRSVYAYYSSFFLDTEARNYTVRLGPFRGTAHDKFPTQKVIPFSTVDRDNDGINSINCAKSYHGGWWFWPANCFSSFLNGEWVPGNAHKAKWLSNPIGFSEMKIRRVEG